MAAKTLCEAGLKVLALNPGRRMDPARDYRNHRQRYEMPFRGFGDPRTRDRRYHDENEYTEGLWEHDIPYTTGPGTEYEWLRVKVTGGKANFWGRSSPRFGDIDFRAASLDGVDVDWPITYEEIAPYYSRIERYVGVASTVQGRPANPDGEYLPPMRFRCLDHILKRGADCVGVPYLPDRIAQLTRSHGRHPQCHYCGECGSGCDTGSFFSPTWFTIPDAERTGSLELRTNAIVRHVTVDDRGNANGVAYVDRDSRQEVEVRARTVVLAASCLETAHIMLNSTSGRWPAGIANGSGQLGRNLCDHLYGSAAYGYLPQLVGREFPDNVSASTIAWKPRWQNLDNRVRSASSSVTPCTRAAASASSRAISAASRDSAPRSSSRSSGTIPRRSASRSRRHRSRASTTTSTSIQRSGIRSAFPPYASTSAGDRTSS